MACIMQTLKLSTLSSVLCSAAYLNKVLIFLWTPALTCEVLFSSVRKMVLLSGIKCKYYRLVDPGINSNIQGSLRPVLLIVHRGGEKNGKTRERLSLVLQIRVSTDRLNFQHLSYSFFYQYNYFCSFNSSHKPPSPPV